MSDIDTATSPKGRVKLDNGTDYVTVACKMPNGLVLQLEQKVEIREPLPSGGVREVTQWRRTPDVIEVKGNAVNFESLRRGMQMPAIEGGFGLTHGVPKAFWDQWLEAHKDDDIVRRGLIFAVKTEQEARKEAATRSDIKSGLEPINPDDPGKFASDTRRIQVGTMTAE